MNNIICVTIDDLKAFTGEWGWLFAIAAALLLILLIIVLIANAVKTSKLKRENRILSEQAAKADAASRESAAVKDSAEKQSAQSVQAAQTVGAPQDKPVRQVEKPVEKAAEKPAPAKAAEKPAPARRAEDEDDEEVVDENTRVKYTVKYDRQKLNWIILKEGNERPTRRVATKSEAMAIARDLSKKHDAALAVHKKDGKFQKH